MVSSAAPEPLGTVRAQHGEGAVWDAATGSLLWIDIVGRAVHRTAADGTTTTTPTADDVGFAVPCHDGSVLAGVGRAVVRLADGAAADRAGRAADGRRATNEDDGVPVEIARTPEAAVPTRTNDAGTDPEGRVWFGTMARDESPGHGALWCLDDAGAAVRVLDDLGTPNGPVWSPDGTTMYFTDTPTGLVRAWAYDTATGVLGADRVAVDARELQGSPDGMTVDADGRLWIAFWGGGAVRCFAPDGRLLQTIPLPVAQPSRPAWGGADGRTLYVTTSRKGLEPDELAEQPLAGRLFAVEPGGQGVVPPAAVVAAG